MPHAPGPLSGHLQHKHSAQVRKVHRKHYIFVKINKTIYGKNNFNAHHEFLFNFSIDEQKGA
jgi:hypothetical protein